LHIQFENVSFSYNGRRDNLKNVSFSLARGGTLGIIGATGSGTLMWDIADTLNGLMAIPNLIALLALSGVVAAETKKYFDNPLRK